MLSDSTMCADAGGLAQTLYNIFSFSAVGDLLCITSGSSFKLYPPTAPFDACYITYQFEIIKVPRNRLARFIRPFADWFNYTYNQTFRKFYGIKKAMLHFNPDVIVSCSNGPVGLFMHHKLLEGLPLHNVFPYFMDDWMNQSRGRFLDKGIHAWAHNILAQNNAWLMISQNLAGILSERYRVKPARVLEIHNPVDLSDAPAIEPHQNNNIFTLAYAGSLWPMHFDAFCVVARAAQMLEYAPQVQIIVYTTADFWNWRKNELEPLGVVYGGNIPYKDIHAKLAQADALILSSSFTKEWVTHSKGSVQTKITDYLKARRLIISCGPSYSANHHFLRQHQCGVCIETNDDQLASGQLHDILTHINDYQSLVYNGWQVLKNEFSFERVHKKLNDFLSGSLN